MDDNNFRRASMGHNQDRNQSVFGPTLDLQVERSEHDLPDLEVEFQSSPQPYEIQRKRRCFPASRCLHTTPMRQGDFGLIGLRMMHLYLSLIHI